MKKHILAIAIGIFATTLCFPQTGEMSRGIFLQEGIASWYGGEFNGRPTASGEIFNDTALTAAHPFLPFGTMLKITNQHNNKTVTVRVNDRGPFVAARIIDLSRSAALQLDMLSTGTAPVKVESLAEVTLPAKPGAVKSVPAAPPAITAGTMPETAGQPVTAVFDGAVRFQPAIPQGYTGKNYRVQVGSYRQAQYAVEAYEKLKSAGLTPAYERYGEFYRVVLPGIKQSELNTLAERLGRAGFREAMLREEI